MDTFDVDDKQSNLSPQDASMYDDQHVYTHTPGSLKNTPVKGALIQSEQKINVDAELDTFAKNWIDSKANVTANATANTTKSAVKKANGTANATTKVNATAVANTTANASSNATDASLK